ncbi:hypothetical protein SCACP_03300 [Sporomusa carbonis]|uniref:CYTH and CHAD domain-containing protein n=1 Tax=Sporomusa carbonis TaxID=3076075 RepID=UPI003A6867FD
MSNTEAELKLRLADPSCLDRLLTSPLLGELSDQPPRKQTLETTYYDTSDQRLLKSRLSYRLRLADGKWTATVKADGSSNGGLHQRAEYNIPVDSPTPDIGQFIATDIGVRLAQAVGDMLLAPIFSTRFERHILDIKTPDGSNIELALDNGAIIAGDKQQHILELELELKDGNPLALVWLGAALAQEFPLLPEQDSKLYRAIVLAGLVNNLSRNNPAPPPLQKTSSATSAYLVLSQVIIFYIHEVIRTQQLFLSNPDDIETLHDFRVTLRRLRVLISFAKPLLPAEGFAAWQDKLRHIGSQLGAVRDLDVFSLAWNQLTDYMTEIVPTAKPVLSTLIADKRQAARNKLYATVAAGQSTPVLLGLWAFIQEWAETRADDNLLPFADFAENRLSGWVKKFLKMGNNINLADMNAVHKLRIAGKRIRYALDALSPALPDNTRLLSKRLKELQNLLGRIHDIAFTPALINELVKASASRLAHRDAGLIIGWQLAQSSDAVADWGKIWPKTKKAAAKFKHTAP